MRGLPGCSDELPFRSLLNKLFRCYLVAIENTANIDIEDAIDVFFGELKDRLDLSDACVGDHDGQRSKLLCRFFDEGFNLTTMRDIGNDSDRVAA